MNMSTESNKNYMAEEKDKQKPKATLIKHRKPESAKSQGEEKQERKKVVVVKKRPKKATPRVISRPDPVDKDKKTPVKISQKTETQQPGPVR